jgi:magnesium transporter
MMTYYRLEGGSLRRQTGEARGEIPPCTLWIDLLHPTPEEERFLEQALAVNIPTREEISEIEDSSRLYESERALHMTTTVVSGFSEHQPSATVVNFVLTREWLVTVRYAELAAFRAFDGKNNRQPELHCSSDMLFVSLLDSLVDRIADVLEAVQSHLNRLAGTVFDTSEEHQQRPTRRPKTDLQAVVKQLGRSNLLLAKLSESLLGINRVLTYLRLSADDWLSDEARAWTKTVERDIASLRDYLANMSSEIGFLLDATLGLINIEQNNIVKVFTIASVLFLPPTLVGTVYGMNFKVMPELDWPHGYPLAVLAMVVSALIPYAWFKHRDWL